MPLQTIYVVRHGYRSAWTTSPTTGLTTSSIRSPTLIPADPALTSYGVHQAEQLATYVSALEPPIDRTYSSSFYRCLQTVAPCVERLTARGVPLICDRGLGEWFGVAHFPHPSPAPLPLLQRFFPTLAEHTSIVPAAYGESVSRLHDRCAYVLASIIASCDSASSSFPVTSGAPPTCPSTILICTHAAAMIAIGRALTGKMPEDVAERDFHTFTASVSVFERVAVNSGEVPKWREGDEVPDVGWRGKGVLGGWRCAVDAGTGHLEGGGERDWGFEGDDTFVGDSWNTAEEVNRGDAVSTRSEKL